MLSWRILPLVALGVSIALATPALGHSTQQQTASGQATLAGFIPPLVAIESGGATSWTSLDITHTFTEGNSVLRTSPRCFDQIVSSNPRTMTFHLDSEARKLFAQQNPGDDPVECTSARVTGSVGVVGFHCFFHPWMNGLLVVYDGAVTTQAAAMLDPVVLLMQGALRA